MFKIGVDAQYLIDGVGRDRSFSAVGANGDLWDEYFATIHDNNLSVQLFKIKSHLTFNDILAGEISVQDFTGNEAADAFAKRGAQIWAVPPEEKREINVLRRQAWRVGMRLAYAVGDVVEKHKNSLCGMVSVKQPRRSMERLQADLADQGHCVIYDSERRRCSCSRCGISFMLNRTQVTAMLKRGQCTALHAPDDRNSTGLSSSISQESQCVHECDEPFEMGKMDLDGSFEPLAAPNSDGIDAVEPTHAPTSRPQAEHRVLKGRLYLTVGAKPVHVSHRMMHWAGVYYCARCGSWGTAETRNLQTACPTRPSAAGIAVLKRIEDRRPPTKLTKLLDGKDIRPCLVTPGCPGRDHEDS